MNYKSGKYFLKYLFGGVTISILLFTGASLSGQYSDFRLWTGLEISKKLNNKLDAKLDLGQRFKDNSTRYDRSLVTASLRYEPVKDFEIRGGYRYILLKDKRLNLVSRYRINLDAVYSYDIGELSMSFKERVQYGFDDLNSIDYLYVNKLTSRTRAEASYHIFSTPLSMFASYELFISLNRQDFGLPLVHRYKAGLSYDLSFKNSIEIAYILDNEVNSVNPLRSHILSISYSLDL